MRPSILAAVAAAFVFCAAPAGAASIEAAGRLAVALDIKGQLDRAIESALAQARSEGAAAGVPAAKLETIIATIREEMVAAAPDLIAEVTRIYAEKFTDGEIKDLIAFYETPTGKKLVAIQQELEIRQLEATERWIQGVMARAQQRLQEAASAKSV